MPWKLIGRRVDVRSTATMVRSSPTAPSSRPTPPLTRTTHRHERLSAGEGRLPDADAGLVPQPGVRDRRRLP
ncbi:hypothetical protein ACWGN5_34230 [Streptomyces sp. NPDC055815]